MLEKEYEFYQENKEELVKKYDNKFIVIKNYKVLGSYETRAAALTVTSKVHEPGTFLIHKVREYEEIARV